MASLARHLAQRLRCFDSHRRVEWNGAISRISGISSGGAQAWQAANNVFRVDSWVQCLLGQRLEPQRWHRMGAVMSEGRPRQNLAEVAQGIASHVEAMPGH